MSARYGTGKPLRLKQVVNNSEACLYIGNMRHGLRTATDHIYYIPGIVCINVYYESLPMRSTGLLL